MAAHVDAAPELKHIARGAAPGAAHLPRANQDLDVVELVEDGAAHVQQKPRPVPHILRRTRRPLTAAPAPTAEAPPPPPPAMVAVDRSTF